MQRSAAPDNMTSTCLVCRRRHESSKAAIEEAQAASVE